jgi:lysophospholipase L1-like esterase
MLTGRPLGFRIVREEGGRNWAGELNQVSGFHRPNHVTVALGTNDITAESDHASSLPFALCAPTRYCE